MDKVMCCDEYKEFLDTLGNIPVDYKIVKGTGVRVLLKYAVNFKRCPYCGNLYDENQTKCPNCGANR